MPQQVRQGLVLLVVAAVVFLTRLGATRLWDDDETFFAQVAREMYDRGDLVVPWFNQSLFSHKPPFMYWMMIGAYHLFGVTEFAARLPSALFGMATVMLVWRLGRILYSPGVGFWAGIVLATSLNFVVISRAATSDTELIFFCTLPIYLYVRGTANRRLAADTAGAGLVWNLDQSLREPSWKNYALIYAAMGMAVLVKGPIGVILPTSVLGLFRLCLRPPARATIGSEKNSRRREIMGSFARVFGPRHVLQTVWRMRPLTAIAALVLVAAPWFVAVGLITHGEFLSGFFGVHHFHRFTSSMDNHSGPVWYYLLAICVGFFPWIIFLSPSALELKRRLQQQISLRPADVLICAWFVVWVGFFSLASTKFPHYVVPAYPALALFTACFLDRWTQNSAIYGKFARNAAWMTVAAAGVGILIVVPFVARLYLQGEPYLGLAGLPLVGGAALCAYFSERRQITRSLASLTVAAMAFFAILFGVAAVQVDRHQNTIVLAESINRLSANGDARIGTLHYFRPGLVYYCNDHIEKLADGEAAIAFLKSSSHPAFLVTSETGYQQIAGNLPEGVGVIERNPWFLKSGETVVLLGPSSSSRGAHLQTVSERNASTGNR